MNMSNELRSGINSDMNPSPKGRIKRIGRVGESQRLDHQEARERTLMACLGKSNGLVWLDIP